MSNLVQSLVPRRLAQTLHHVKSGQNHQIRAELVQTLHKTLHEAHLSIRLVMRKDEPVGLRCHQWAPALTCTQANGHNAAKTWSNTDGTSQVQLRPGQVMLKLG